MCVPPTTMTWTKVSNLRPGRSPSTGPRRPTAALMKHSRIEPGHQRRTDNRPAFGHSVRLTKVNSTRSVLHLIGGSEDKSARRYRRSLIGSKGLEVVAIACVWRATYVGNRVHVEGFGAECLRSAVFPWSSGKWVEGKVSHSVEVRDLVDLFITEGGKLSLVHFWSVRPRAVGMWKIRLPAHIVDIEVLDQAHTHWIINKAAEHPLAEYVGRSHAIGERVARPSGVPVLNVLSSL